MPDLVFVSMEDWDDVWRRNQFLCSGLARRYPEMRILFVGLPRHAVRLLQAGEFQPLLGPGNAAVPGLPQVTVTRALRVGPERYDWGVRLNQELTLRHVRRAMREAGIRRPILWLNPHSALHLAGKLDERAVIYDITDDWISFEQPERMRRQICLQDAELCRRADAVIVCSERLYQMKRTSTESLHLIPNGVDTEHYLRVLHPGAGLPRDAAGWRKPVLGYTGTIHPERVDTALIEALAKEFREGTVVLIGPNHLPAAQRSRLQSLGNVVQPGPVPYGQIPDYMRAFDVCITPHRVTPFTESLNPIKLWEYLAAGKPIVSTPVAGFRDYPELVHLARNTPEFLNAVRQALREKGEISEARRLEARGHSWESRVDAVERILTAVTT